jgi:hypothetical protein
MEGDLVLEQIDQGLLEALLFVDASGGYRA